MSVFVQNSKKKEMEIFLFYVITFEPITTETYEGPLNDCQNLRFVKDEHAYSEKMAKIGHTRIICKVIFILKYGQNNNRLLPYIKCVPTTFSICSKHVFNI